MLVPIKAAITLIIIVVRKLAPETDATAPEKGKTISLEIGKQAYSIVIIRKIAIKPYLKIKFVNIFKVYNFLLYIGSYI